MVIGCSNVQRDPPFVRGSLCIGFVGKEELHHLQIPNLTCLVEGCPPIHILVVDVSAILQQDLGRVSLISLLTVHNRVVQRSDAENSLLDIDILPAVDEETNSAVIPHLRCLAQVDDGVPD